MRLAAACLFFFAAAFADDSLVPFVSLYRDQECKDASQKDVNATTLCLGPTNTGTYFQIECLTDYGCPGWYRRRHFADAFCKQAKTKDMMVYPTESCVVWRKDESMSTVCAPSSPPADLPAEVVVYEYGRTAQSSEICSNPSIVEKYPYGMCINETMMSVVQYPGCDHIALRVDSGSCLPPFPRRSWKNFQGCDTTQDQERMYTWRRYYVVH